jgi:hypothetical protein
MFHITSQANTLAHGSESVSFALYRTINNVVQVKILDIDYMNMTMKTRTIPPLQVQVSNFHCGTLLYHVCAPFRY